MSSIAKLRKKKENNGRKTGRTPRRLAKNSQVMRPFLSQIDVVIISQNCCQTQPEQSVVNDNLLT